MATLPTVEELTGVITQGGFKNAIAKLRNYVAENVGANGGTGKQIITATGTWTVPDGVTQIYVSGCGAGGGGSTMWGCGGGGGQSCYRTPLTVTPGENISVAIGTGGAGNMNNTSSSNSLNGNDGTNTSFGSYLTLAGGKGAAVTFSSFLYNGGAAGGTNGTPGETMKTGFYASSSNYTLVGGQGGSSLFGVGGTGGVVNVQNTSVKYEGGNGIGWGSGGGGGGAAYISGTTTWWVAGNGANGVIIIEW